VGEISWSEVAVSFIGLNKKRMHSFGKVLECLLHITTKINSFIDGIFYRYLHYFIDGIFYRYLH
jgi:hypothetical protein